MARRGFGNCSGRTTLHHVATGSGKRDDWACVPLCEEHHQGGSGLHGMGNKGFCSLYRVPGEREEGLLIWLIEAMAKDRI